MSILKRIKLPARYEQLTEKLALEIGVIKGKHPEAELELFICSKAAKRTVDANAYYWGVVIKGISDHWGELPADVHEYLKKIFLLYYKEIHGEMIELVKSTSKLSKKDFWEYVEMCRTFAGMQGIDIPDPESVPDEVYVRQLNDGIV